MLMHIKSGPRRESPLILFHSDARIPHGCATASRSLPDPLS